MKTLMLLLLVLAGAHAKASIVSADFSARSGLPYCVPCAPYDQGPVTLSAKGQAVGAGVELGAGATYDNPSGWWGGIVHIDLDPVAKTLTLLSQDDYDFESFVAEIGNIKFGANERITGLSLVSNDLTEDLVVDPVLFFTGNSLRIVYDSPDGFYFTGRSAEFRFTTEEVTAAVPEPATAVLFLLGSAALFGRRRPKN